MKIKRLKFFLIVSVLVILLVVLFTIPQNEAKVLFVGDMFFDRTIRKVMYEKGEDYVFSCISDFLHKYDFVVGNLEGPITENASVSLFSEVESPDNFIFTFPTITAKLLAKNNVEIVSLGNNHIGNFGLSGIESTKKLLGKAGVGYFGGLRGDDPVYRTKIGNKNVSFIAYNDFGGDDAETTATKIKEEKENGNVVIVFPHWGDEYSAANSRQKRLAKLFADSGASAIIGAHPHVIQEKAVIGDTAVYYSLGNFIFDQYWNSDVSTGLAIEMIVRGDKLEFIEHKVKIERGGQTCLAK